MAWALSTLLLTAVEGAPPLRAHYAVGRDPTNAAVADFNGDERMDLAVACHDLSFPRVVLLMGFGEGRFVQQLPVIFPGGGEGPGPKGTKGTNGEKFAWARPVDVAAADLDGDGQRQRGRAGGFSDASPSLGEPFYLADDVNGNGRLDVGEKLVVLGSSKLAVVRVDGDVYRRGDNLVDAPIDEEVGHGCGARGVIAGG